MRWWILSVVAASTACVPEFEGQVDLPGGYGVGELVPDAPLPDQNGELVSLRDFEDLVVLLDISTMWCAPCQDVAKHAEETFLDYKDEGFMYVTVLQEDVEGGELERSDLRNWAKSFDITSPVLGDSGAPEERVTASAIENGQFPAILIIGRDGVVVERVPSTVDSAIRESIEKAL